MEKLQQVKIDSPAHVSDTYTCIERCRILQHDGFSNCPTVNKYVLLKHNFPLELKKYSHSRPDRRSQPITAREIRRNTRRESSTALLAIPETHDEVDQAARSSVTASPTKGSRPATLRFLPTGSSSADSPSLSGEVSVSGRKGKATKEHPAGKKQHTRPAKKILMTKKSKDSMSAVPSVFSSGAASSPRSGKKNPLIGNIGQLDSTECHADVEDFDAASPFSPLQKDARPPHEVSGASLQFRVSRQSPEASLQSHGASRQSPGVSKQSPGVPKQSPMASLQSPGVSSGVLRQSSSPFKTISFPQLTVQAEVYEPTIVQPERSAINGDALSSPSRHRRLKVNTVSSPTLSPPTLEQWKSWSHEDSSDTDGLLPPEMAKEKAQQRLGSPQSQKKIQQRLGSPQSQKKIQQRSGSPQPQKKTLSIDHRKLSTGIKGLTHYSSLDNMDDEEPS